MDKTILVGLGGRPDRFRLDPDAYDRLERYLDRSSARLQGDPDRAEVMGDLERSLGDKLAAITGGADRVVTAAEIDGVLEEIGAVDTGRDPGPDETGRRADGSAVCDGSMRGRRSPASAPAWRTTRRSTSTGCAGGSSSDRSSPAASSRSSTSR